MRRAGAAALSLLAQGHAGFGQEDAAPRCPGTLPVGGLQGPVELVPAGWGMSGAVSSNVEVDSDNRTIKAGIGSRSYLATTCTAGQYDGKYVAVNLLGKTLRYSVLLSGAGCGCNAGLSLVPMTQNKDAGECGDFYCDSSTLCGVRCAEINVQEAGQYAWHSTLHASSDGSGKCAGYGGQEQVPHHFSGLQYGRGGECVDTTEPFQVEASFPVDGTGQLRAMEVTLSQEGHPCKLNITISDYEALPALTEVLSAGVTPVISYWSSKDMLWLDGKTADGRGPCESDHPDVCSQSVTFGQISIEPIEGAVATTSTTKATMAPLEAILASATTTPAAASTSTGISTSSSTSSSTVSSKQATKPEHNITKPSTSTSTSAKRQQTTTSSSKAPHHTSSMTLATTSRATSMAPLVVVSDKDECPAFVSKNSVPDDSVVGLHGHLSVRDNMIVGEHGKPVRLRGVSLYFSQWRAQFWNRATVDWLMKDWGVTLVRAAMGVEMGGYSTNPDQEVAKVESVINACVAAGIYVLVDFHSYLADLRIDQAKDFFKDVSSKYGHLPNVLFETYSEPLTGTHWKKAVKPYHQQLVSTIREHSNNLIVLGTADGGQRVDQATMDPVEGENLAYSLHFFAAEANKDVRARLEEALDRRPVIVSQWGPCMKNSSGRLDFNASSDWLNFFREHSVWDVSWAISDNPDETCSMLQEGASGRGGWGLSELTDAGRFARASLRGEVAPAQSVLKNYEPVNGNTTCSDDLTCAGNVSVSQCAMLCDADEDCHGFSYDAVKFNCAHKSELTSCLSSNSRPGAPVLYRKSEFRKISKFPVSGSTNWEESCRASNALGDGFEYLFNSGRGSSSAACGRDADYWCCARERLQKDEAAWQLRKNGSACSNAKLIALLEAPTTEGAASICALKCSMHKGCTSFAFKAKGKGCAGPAAESTTGDCMLWSGSCDVNSSASAEDAACWDQYDLSLPPAVADTPVAAHDLRFGARTASIQGVQAPTTALSEPVQAGATTLNVDSQDGFLAGDQVVISGGGNSETHTIACFGSIVLTEPLEHSYPAGSTVTGGIEAASMTSDSLHDHMNASTYAQPLQCIDDLAGEEDVDYHADCLHRNKLEDGHAYVYNHWRGRLNASCGKLADCWCCRRNIAEVPPTASWRLAKNATGCSNSRSISYVKPTVEKSPNDCGIRCQGQQGCVGFGFQASEKCSLFGEIPGTCVLWFGACEHEVNSCWELYEMRVYENATAAGSSAQNASGSKWGLPTRAPPSGRPHVASQKPDGSLRGSAEQEQTGAEPWGVVIPLVACAAALFGAFAGWSLCRVAQRAISSPRDGSGCPDKARIPGPGPSSPRASMLRRLPDGDERSHPYVEESPTRVPLNTL